MASDSDSTMTESGASAARRRTPAVLKAGGPLKPEPDAVANEVLLKLLLAMAQRYRSEDKLREAMDLYWELVEDHPRTAAAGAAKSVLLELAACYERNATPHLARGIYERLLDDGD